MNSLSLVNACVTLKGVPILKDVSLSLKPSTMIGLLGPNGAGKTTAIRALLGLQALTSGQALIGGKPVSDMAPRDRALAVSYLPQARQFVWPIGVREAVALGRFAYGGAMGRLGPQDAHAVDDALVRCDLASFANRSVTSLSGGELARVHMARAFAAEAPALIADEPIAALDPRHALDILSLLQNQARAGDAVMVILHDLSLAARFCDEIILMDGGKVIATGPARDTLTVPMLRDVYDIAGNWDGGELRISGR
jgi:iron complex transport system ATP-binding protein